MHKLLKDASEYDMSQKESGGHVSTDKDDFNEDLLNGPPVKKQAVLVPNLDRLDEPLGYIEYNDG